MHQSHRAMREAPAQRYQYKLDWPEAQDVPKNFVSIVTVSGQSSPDRYNDGHRADHQAGSAVIVN